MEFLTLQNLAFAIIGYSGATETIWKKKREHHPVPWYTPRTLSLIFGAVGGNFFLDISDGNYVFAAVGAFATAKVIVDLVKKAREPFVHT